MNPGSLNNALQSAFLLFLLLSSSNSQSNFCKTKCVCVHPEKTIVCQQETQIREIPRDIDPKFLHLTLQQGTFDYPYISKRNMTNLSQLITLKIIRYKLKYMAPHTFSDMKQLTNLDLSYNNFAIIPPYTFQGLRLLSLHLTHNQHIQLTKESFNGLTSEMFNLRSSNLKTIYFELFELTNVKQLNLYNNSIRTLDSRFSKLFKSYDSFIDLTDNPLNCDCSISWLKQHLQQKITKKKDVNIECGSPRELFQKPLVSVSRDQLKCVPLEINEIRISFDNHKTPTISLTCISSLGGFKSPKISWLKVNSNYNRHLYDYDSKSTQFLQMDSQKQTQETIRSPKGDKIKVINTLNLTINELEDRNLQLICSASNDQDSSRKLEIQISNLKRLYQNLGLTTKPPNKSSGSVNTTNSSVSRPDYSFLFERHFSLIELIAAIFGTFALTFLGIMMIVKLVQYNTKKSLGYQATLNEFKQQINQANTIQPYMFTATPYDYSSTYSVPQDPYVVFPMGYHHQNEDSNYPVTATTTTTNPHPPYNMVINQNTC